LITSLSCPSRPSGSRRPAAGQSVPRWVLTFEPRAHPLSFVHLCRSSNRVIDAFPDGRETASERGFDVVDCLEDGFVGAVEQWCDLVYAEERISVEDESNEELAGGEFRVVEGCATGIGGFPVTASTPNPG